MKRTGRLAVTACIALLLITGSVGMFSAGLEEEAAVQAEVVREFTPVSLDDLPIPAYDYQRANKLPMTGYFEKTFTVNGRTRTAKFYLPCTTPIRGFYTVIAVPEGIDTTEFMTASGWMDIAKNTDEGLVLLEPAADGWNSPAFEIDYVDAVLKFYSRNSYFSIFGISYFVGYDGGATALEAWAAANPLKVVSQAYVNSTGLEGSYYDQFDDVYFDGLSSGYEPVEIPQELKFAVSDVPVPTAFVSRDLDSVSEGIAYWKKVNDTAFSGSADTDCLYGATVYAQSRYSDAWATAYAGPISKVAVLEADVDVLSPQLTQSLYDFVTAYVSYDNTTAYGNFIAPRADFGEIRTMLVNGEVREFQVYVPESADDIWPDGAPVIFVFAGNTQTDQVFFHNTLWWKVAEEEGVILAIPCETYSASSTSVSHANTGMFYEKLADYMTKYYHTDPTRYYATGQSAGSFAVQGFAITNPDYFAAVASTSGLAQISEGGGFGSTAPELASHEPVPTFCFLGEGDIGMMTGTLWDDTVNMLDGWAEYFLEANQVGPLGDGSNVETNGRFTTWTWKNEQGFPLFKVGRTSYRAHNCIPAEMPLLWDFMKHWSLKDGVRYYDGVAVR
jgi:poly(3-hydroxybutyrate) depolymerase